MICVTMFLVNSYLETGLDECYILATYTGTYTNGTDYSCTRRSSRGVCL